MSKKFSFPVATKFRVIVGGNVCFYTTKKQILAGVGDLIPFNAALLSALKTFESLKFEEGTMVGYGGTHGGFQIQLNA